MKPGSTAKALASTDVTLLETSKAILAISGDGKDKQNRKEYKRIKARIEKYLAIAYQSEFDSKSGRRPATTARR